MIDVSFQMDVVMHSGKATKKAVITQIYMDCTTQQRGYVTKAR